MLWRCSLSVFACACLRIRCAPRNARQVGSLARRNSRTCPGRIGSDLMNILGVSCYYHDAAAALLRDGQLVAAAEEERFSRIKHDFDFPRNAIRFCLREAKLDARDLDYVVFFEKPFRKFDRILLSVLQTYPRSWKVFRESMITWMIDKLWVGST